ncbi:aminomethyltransferase, mitochondrial [Euwallacea fornicatus]|uniref:aminomethyltransferase, mitochondrial n=1 Tax=Euwallacea fornicatus TaxID=995702 RepID=UPI00338E4F68
MFSPRKLLTNPFNSWKNILQVLAYSTHPSGETTTLYDFHVKHGGKMVNFGGFILPVQYSDQSIINSHLFTRKSASVFDVSHMLQTEITGKNCVEYIETLCTADIQGLKENNATLTVFTNEKGGILDDLIVTKVNEEFIYVVSNAAMKDQDQGIMLSGLANYKKLHKPDSDINIKFLKPNARSLVALQGPGAAAALQKLTNIDLSTLYFMNSIVTNVADTQYRITRCGYTGEDGFELSIDSRHVEKIVTLLLEDGEVKLAGLGARDSLRLEAGLCLYGSDLNANTTPIEGALTWLVAKRRREQQNFPGASKILQQIKEGSKIKRVGVTSTLGPPARHGAEILDERGNVIGEVTSGCPSPTLNLNISMGYVPTEFSKVGTKVGLKIRNKTFEGIVTKMPFVKAKYYNKPKAN